MCGGCSVWEQQFKGVAVCVCCGLGKLWSVAVAVWRKLGWLPNLNSMGFFFGFYMFRISCQKLIISKIHCGQIIC